MKIKNNWLETSIYCILCILSFGIVYLMRLIITIAIRTAFKNEE